MAQTNSKKKTTAKNTKTRKITNNNHNTSREKQRTAIAIAILLMAVGFAAVTTTLTINGTINYGYDKDKFIVKFTEASLDGVNSNDVEEGKPTIDSEGHTITYTSKELKTINEESVLTFKVQNQSTQYDATVNIKCEEVDDRGENSTTKLVNKYITLNGKLGENEQPTRIDAGSTADGTVTVKLIKATVDEQSTNIKCTLEATPLERTSSTQ